MKPQLVVMLKEPRAGRVKTRLGRDIGMTSAAWWFRHQVADLLRRIDDPRWDLLLAVSPLSAVTTSRTWPAHLPRRAQGHGDLGQRMARQFRQPRKGPICIIGGDIPGITRSQVARAFQALGANEAVFGPAPDGGYWLVGLKRTAPPPPSLFENVRWSSPNALSDSIASLPGKRIAMIDTLRDVDTVADLSQTFHR